MALILPEDEKEPIEFAIDRWLELLQHEIDELRRLDLDRLVFEMSAFKAGFKQGRHK